MEIVIVGAGEVGFNVARSLSQDGHDVVVIENDPERATKVENELDVMVVRGNGARPNVLERAGIKEGTSVELLIACSSKDEVNILACWIARKMGVKRVISRAVGMEFTDGDTWSKQLGIDVMVSPERSVAREVAGLFETQGAVLSNEIDEKAGLYAFRVEEGCAAAGLDLMQLRQKNPQYIMIVVYVQRGDSGFIPKASDKLEPGDICYSFCYIDQIKEISQLFRLDKSRKLRSVMIIGGGKVGYQTARYLLSKRKGLDIKLIDLDKQRGVKVANELPEIMVLWGDGGDEDFLLQEGVSGVDGFLAATENDEKNIMFAVIAKTLGARKSIAVIRRRSYVKLVSHLPVDAILNRNDTLSSVIISAVRHPENASTLMIFDQLGAETLQITIPESSAAAGVCLKDLGMPQGSIIGLVRREGAKKDIFIPTGMFKFAPGDKAIVFSAQGAVDDVLKKLGARSD